jgi:Transposase
MVDVVCVEQPQASWEERSMKHYAGLDVSVKETSLCIVDEVGRICREMKVVSHPEDLLAVLCDPAWRLERVGLEAGPLSQWLFSGLAEAGVPAICIETRHAKAFLKAQVNKSDRNDARGIAQMMRVGLFRPVHVKTLADPFLKDAVRWKPYCVFDPPLPSKPGFNTDLFIASPWCCTNPTQVIH